MSMTFLRGLLKPNVAKMHSKIDVRGLIKALHYKESAVRQAAAEALGKIGDAGAVDAPVAGARGACITSPRSSVGLDLWRRI